MGFTPSLDRVLIEREEKDEVSEGGIILADQSQVENPEGTVVAVGPGAWFLHEGEPRRFPMTYKVGDRVLLPTQGSGLMPKVKVEGKEYVLLKEGDILGNLD